MNDDAFNEELDIPLYSDRTSLSIDEAVHFMIEGDSDLKLPRAYETVVGGTVLDRLQFCCEKAESNYAEQYPDKTRSTQDLNNARNALKKANEYLVQLQSDLPKAKSTTHAFLQWDQHASGVKGWDMFLKGSVIAWAYHTFGINPFGLYNSATDEDHNQLSSIVPDTQPLLHEKPEAAKLAEETTAPRMSSSAETASTDSEAHQHLAVTVYLVADALSRHLNTLEDDSSDEKDTSTRYGNNEGVIDCAEISAYVVAQRNGAQTDLPSDQRGHGAVPMDETKTSALVLYLLLQTLAERLAEAIKNGDLEIWRHHAPDKMEEFIRGDGTYSAAAIQRYISKHILLNEKFPGQGGRVMQGRFNAAKEQSTEQQLSYISEEEIRLCLQRAAQQFNLVAAKAKGGRPTRTRPTR